MVGRRAGCVRFGEVGSPPVPAVTEYLVQAVLLCWLTVGAIYKEVLDRTLCAVGNNVVCTVNTADWL